MAYMLAKITIGSQKATTSDELRWRHGRGTILHEDNPTIIPGEDRESDMDTADGGSNAFSRSGRLYSEVQKHLSPRRQATVVQTAGRQS